MKHLLRALSAFPLSLPLAFEPAPEAGRFLARQGDARVEVACDAIEVAWGAREPRVRIGFAGADAGVLAVPSEPQPGRVHYLIGSDATQWRRNLPLHGRLTCSGIRPGLDLAVYGRDGRIEFDVIAAPGADLGALELAIVGADERTLEPDGDLALRAGARQLVLRAPVAYQELGGVRRAVESRFAARGPARFGFAVGPHDPNAPLVIDPVLELSTYAGGNRLDTARAVAVAADGSVLVAGTQRVERLPDHAGRIPGGVRRRQRRVRARRRLRDEARAGRREPGLGHLPRRQGPGRRQRRRARPGRRRVRHRRHVVEGFPDLRSRRVPA